MKYRIITNNAVNRAEKRRRFIKWFIYSLLLLFFYVLMRTGVFELWQPVFIIPLCVAVAMHEEELPASIFALCCGYMMDIAFDFIFGFSVIWLMTACIFASLLVRNLIRINLMNFIGLCAAAIFLEFSMHYLFNVFVWNIPGGEVILIRSILPTAAATLAVSPLMYLLVRKINGKFGTERSFADYNADEEKEQISGNE